MTTVQSFEVNYFSENTYIVYDETKEGVIIDCGCMNKEEQQLISRFVSEQQLTLKRYLCTHLHLDHIFGNQFVWKQYGLKPEASKADVEGLPSPIDQAKAFRLPLAIQEVAVEHFLAGPIWQDPVGGDLSPGAFSRRVGLLQPEERVCHCRRLTLCRQHRTDRLVGWQPRAAASRLARSDSVASRRDHCLSRSWAGDTCH